MDDAGDYDNTHDRYYDDVDDCVYAGACEMMMMMMMMMMMVVVMMMMMMMMMTTNNDDDDAEDADADSDDVRDADDADADDDTERGGDDYGAFGEHGHNDDYCEGGTDDTNSATGAGDLDVSVDATLLLTIMRGRNSLSLMQMQA